jgi:hypothetical protein
MLRAVKLQFIFVFMIIAITPCPTYSKEKRVINVQRVKLTSVTNDIQLYAYKRL